LKDKRLPKGYFSPCERAHGWVQSNSFGLVVGELHWYYLKGVIFIPIKYPFFSFLSSLCWGRGLLIFLVVVLLQGCESDNDHFCAKYSFYYGELTQPGILPRQAIRQQLEKKLSLHGSDKTKMMLFVLNELDADVKRESEPAQEYCLRRQRWKAYKR